MRRGEEGGHDKGRQSGVLGSLIPFSGRCCYVEGGGALEEGVSVVSKSQTLEWWVAKLRN